MGTERRRTRPNSAIRCPRASEGAPIVRRSSLRAGPGRQRSRSAPGAPPGGWWEVRAYSLNVLVVAVLWLSGCLAHQGPTRDWLVYTRDPRGAGEGVPVARVTLAGASHGNVVDVAVR